MVVGLLFHPCAQFNGMRQHGEDRKFVIALLTKDAVTLDCRHNRKNSSDKMRRKLPSARGTAEAWLLKPSVALKRLDYETLRRLRQPAAQGAATRPEDCL
jgi:hypothetical protein